MQEQHQTQDAQNAQQNEYPANAGSGHNESQKSASDDDTQIDQLADSWRPTEDSAIEQAGGTTQPGEEEPEDGNTQETGTNTEP